MRLTRRNVFGIPLPGAGVQFLWDDLDRRFGIRVSYGGARSYVVRIYRGGRDTTRTLGRIEDISVDEARKRAAKLLGRRLEETREVPLSELLDEYWKSHVDTRNSARTAMDKAKYRMWLEKLAGPLCVSDITRRLVSSWHNEVMKRHGSVQANRFLAFVQHLVAKAVEWEMIPTNPASRMRKFPEQKRERWLGLEEIQKWRESVELENPTYRAYFNVLLLTGQRRTEVRRMRWEDVDFERELWTIPRTKSGRPHIVPLNATLLGILRSLPRVSEFVFAGDKGTPINGLGKSWLRVRARCGLNDIRIHDIRRTFGSQLATHGFSPQKIMAAMGHSQLSTAQIYQHISDTSKREAMEAIEKITYGITSRAPSLPETGK